MKCPECGREDCLRMVNEYTDWARDAARSFVQELLSSAGDIDDRKARSEIFSACLGVVIAVLRETVIRTEISNPTVVEMIASLEVTKRFRAEARQIQTKEEHLRENLEGQVPS